jgi:hypothetical protein
LLPSVDSFRGHVSFHFLFHPIYGARVWHPFHLCFDRHEQVIKLNFHNLKQLDSLLVGGYREWVENAPDHWKVDGFLKNKSPIVVTSRFGQNAWIATPGNEAHEAIAWQLERDYSKLAFVTFALATSIQ